MNNAQSIRKHPVGAGHRPARPAGVGTLMQIHDGFSPFMDESIRQTPLLILLFKGHRHRFQYKQ